MELALTMAWNPGSASRGMSAHHPLETALTIPWNTHYVPEFERRWNRFTRPAGLSWRVDETYVKIKGRWTYLYRAVDKEGKTIDFLLRAKRDVAAAKAFFRRAFSSQGRLPHKITLDGYQGLSSRGRRGSRRTSGGKSMRDPVVQIPQQFD
jgi:transposase-like protein